MNNILFSSVVAALLILSGCSTKKPAIDAEPTQKQEAQEVEAVETETVVTDDASDIDGSSIAVADSSELSMSKIEKKMETVYFDFDQFFIRTDMQGRVSNGANIANNDAKKFMIKLEGNCDEWGSDEYNFALGLKRANAVKNALIAEEVSAERITMVSYGESNPVCNEKTKDCWSKNRRVDFKLLP